MSTDEEQEEEGKKEAGARPHAGKSSPDESLMNEPSVGPSVRRAAAGKTGRGFCSVNFEPRERARRSRVELDFGGVVLATVGFFIAEGN